MIQITAEKLKFKKIEELNSMTQVRAIIKIYVFSTWRFRSGGLSLKTTARISAYSNTNIGNENLMASHLYTIIMALYKIQWFANFGEWLQKSKKDKGWVNRKGNSFGYQCHGLQHTLSVVVWELTDPSYCTYKYHTSILKTYKWWCPVWHHQEIGFKIQTTITCFFFKTKPIFMCNEQIQNYLSLERFK